ncbi:MAG TPA: hypothetical protein PLZ21_07955 [Armatimonadota bacterium]|nr:hypothetical protein [Armatimonadota bacterium]HOP80479.1 hypothetical protein [Armatimonadota bacterium]
MNQIDVKRVEEVRTSYEANRFLELGWMLLQVFPATSFHPQDRYPTYVMGWARDTKPTYPPN